MNEHDLDPDPIVALGAWLDEAQGAFPRQWNAMTLATATADGRPSARVVLLRGLDERGLTFFTNRASRKAEELEANAYAAVVLHWWELGRQIRIEGSVERTTNDESNAYWSSRPRGSRIAAWASAQSRPVGSRDELESGFLEQEARFADDEVPLPPFWGGYRVVPDAIEFWTHADNRLHDRIRYIRESDGWRRERLAP
ncbi:MAG: pyridoxamine 5'-phosphate oxidase [Gaiellaceae bacterium]